MDRISLLPDEILGHILSFLPTKQVVSTSLLSKRWRNVFHLVSSLEFDYDKDFESQRSKYYKRKKFMDYVEGFFRLQGKSPIKKFALKTHISGLNSTRVQNWICNVLERGVVDLNLLCGRKNRLLIFKNSTLVKLRLDGGIKINLSQDVYLPKLRTLCLRSVGYDGVHSDVFETLLPRCPVLEELVVNHQPWIKGHITVSSRSLKKLTITLFNSNTISLDVPNLVCLQLLCYFGVKYVNVNLDSLVEARLSPCVRGNRLLQKLRRGSADLVPADKIDIIIRIRNVRVLQLTSDALEMFYFSGQELPMFDNLVRLCISSEKTEGWQILPLMIKNSPNLETLIFRGLQHYETINCGDVCVCNGEKSSSCLSSCRVKVLEICPPYRGTLKEVNQIKHFLKKLPCLELVKIKAVNNVMPISLQTLPRASLNCRFQF